MLTNTLLLALALSAPADAAPALLLGDEVEADSLDRKILKRLCLGASTQHGGTRIELVLPPTEEPAQIWLLENIVKQKAEAFERTWTRRVLSGNGVEPRRLSATEAARFVAEHPTAIAVVEADDLEGTEGLIPLSDLP